MATRVAIQVFISISEANTLDQNAMPSAHSVMIVPIYKSVILIYLFKDIVILDELGVCVVT